MRKISDRAAEAADMPGESVAAASAGHEDWREEHQLLTESPEHANTHQNASERPWIGFWGVTAERVTTRPTDLQKQY